MVILSVKISSILNGTASNSGDIHTAGGDDGLAVIQMTTNNGKIRIAGKIVVVLM